MAVNDDVYSATTAITPGYGSPRQNQNPTIPRIPKDVLAKPKEQKPSYQEFTPPTFQDFAARRAVEDGVTSLANADAKVLRDYAKEYAEKVMPGAILAKHGKVDKNYISSVSEAFQTNIHKNQEQWKAYYKAIEEKNKPTEPARIGSMYGRNFLPGPVAQTLGKFTTQNAISELSKTAQRDLGDITQSGIGATSTALGQTVGGTAKLADKAFIPRDLPPSENTADWMQSQYSKQVGTPGSTVFSDLVQPFVERQAQAGKLAQEQTSPEFKQATAPDAPWSPTLVASRVANTFGALAPQLAGGGMGVVPSAIAGAGQFGQQAKEARIDEIRAIPNAELVKSPRIQALLAEGIPLDQAREQVAQAAGEGAFGPNAAIGAILGFTSPVTSAARNVLAKVAGKSLPARVATGAAVESGVLGTGMGAGQVAGNVATGEALGDEAYPTFRGAGKATAQGALLGGIVGGIGAAGNARIPNVRDVLRFGGKGTPTPETKPPTAAPEATPQEGTPLEAAPANASPDVVLSAARQATAENPIPTPEVLKDPGQAQASYAKWEETVQADLMGGEGWTEAQFKAAIPDLKRAWADEAKVNPAILEEQVAAPVEEALTPEELNQVAPADVRTAQEPTMTPDEVRGQIEPTTSEEAALQPNVDESIPLNLREVVSRDLFEQTGALPTAEEINLAGKVAIEANLKDTNSLLPEQYRREAIGRLYEKRAEITPEAVNKFAKNIAAKRAREAQATKVDALKKAEAGTQVSEPAFNAAKDVSLEPNGRTVESVRQELGKSLEPRAIQALEKAGILKLVPNIESLPKNLQSENMSGVYAGRSAYLVADRMAPGSEWRTLVHELGVHYGMRDGAIPAKLYDAIEAHIQSNLKGDSAEAKEIQAAQKSAIDSDTDPLILTNETIAHMVQSRMAQTPGTIWNKAWNAIKTFLYDKIGKHLPLSISRKLINNDLISKLAQSATRNMAGRVQNQAQTRLQDVPAYNRAERKALIEANTAERVAEAIKIRSKPTEKELSEVEKMNSLSASEKFADQWVNDLNSLKNVNQKLAEKGITVSRKANMFDEGTRLQATSRHATVLAEQRFVDPAINWAVKKALSLKQDPVEFTDNLSQWYMGKHNLEVNERGFLEKARLKKVSAIERDAVVQQWMKGELPEGQYLERLRSIVNKPGALVSGRDVLPKSEMTDLAAKILVAKARKAGITPEIIQEFEPYRQDMVNAIAENGLASGKFSPDDAARVSGIGSKYYVPSKGSAEAEVTGLDFQKLKSGAFGKTYTALEGRDTISKNPLLSLMQDTLRSAKDVAESKFTKTVYNWAKEHGKEFGVSTETHNIEKEMRDAVAAGKGLNDISKIYDRENVVIHNAGNYRFIIRFPENSPYLKSIKSLSGVVEPGSKLQELAKKFTNSQGYLATVARPTFVLWNGVWNDVFGNLGQVTVDYGPGAGLEYAKNWVFRGGPARGVSYYFKGSKQFPFFEPTNALQREQIAASPNATRFAKIMEKFVEHGGDLSFDQMQNATRSIYALSKRLEQATSKTASLIQKRDAILSYLEQMGNVSNMTGRAAAYETVVRRESKKLEKSLGRKLNAEEKYNLDADAVLYARRITDFLQTSEKGKFLNAHYMFARMAISQADRVISTVKDAKGKIDYKKLGLLMAAGNAFSALLYATLRQANPNIAKQDDDTVASKFTIPFGDKVITIPMGYGPTRLLLVPGIMATRWALGDTTGKQAMLTVRDTLLTSLTPFRPSASTPGESTGNHIMDLVEGATPTYARPIVQSARNKTIFGSTITAEPKFVDDSAFRSDSGRASTPPEWKWLAQTLNKLGVVDMFPETLEYLVGAYGSGPANDLMRGIATLQKKSEGLDIEPQKLPFAPTIFSSDAEYYAQRKLKEREASLMDDSKRMNYAKKQGTQAVSELLRKEPKMQKNLDELKKINSMQTRFNKERKDIEKDTLLSPKVRADKMKQLSKDFNKEATALIETR